MSWIYPGIDLEFRETEYAFQVRFIKNIAGDQGVEIKAAGEAAGEADKIERILEFCRTPQSATEIMKFIGLTHREHFRLKFLVPLLNKGGLIPTIPDKPISPKQKYVIGGHDT